MHRLLTRALLGCLPLLPVAAQAYTPTLYLTPDEATPVAQVAIAKHDPEAPVTLNADAMAMDEQNGVVIAQGNVEVMQGDMILTAQQITYYQRRDMVVATGEVTMLQPTGDVYFAEKAELKDGMKKAVINQFMARMKDNSVLAADRAVKINSSVTALKKASYTPCKLCPNSAPFWQMNAESIVVDDIDERMTYRGAFMEMFGIPMFYTPYLSHPTPDARGKSGFLAPVYTTNRYFGATAKVPYYWRIDEDQDLVVTPWMTASEGPLLELDYNQLTNNGDYEFRGSITNPSRLNDAGEDIGGNELRWHIFAQGAEQLDDHSRVGIDIQRTSDDTYLRRYGFGDQQALFSRAYYEQAEGRNFMLAQGLSIQGLRSADSGKTTPLVLPILQGFYETPANDFGMKFHLAADAQWLTREVGVDQRRVSVTPGMSMPIAMDSGQLLKATFNVRQDIYSGEDVPTNGGATSFDGTTTRTMPQAALEWRYPLINTFESGSWVVEPIALGVLQPNGKNPEEISNEDSSLIELSDTNLFSLERMPGLDLYDSGSRVAYGMRSHYYDASGVALDALVGQNYSVGGNTPFPNSTTEGEEFSDYIGRLGVSYAPVSLTYRFALDKNEMDFNRNEVAFGFSEPWITFSAGYRAIEDNRYIDDSQEALAYFAMPIDDQWSIYGSGRRDIELAQMVTANGGIIYKNECFNIMFDTLRVYARDRDITPTTEFTFRVAFKNLGEFGGQ
jgi:LPS-assembly protein